MLKPIITSVNGKRNFYPFDLSQTQIELLVLSYYIDRRETIFMNPLEARRSKKSYQKEE
jgi:hypothetical protein